MEYGVWYPPGFDCAVLEKIWELVQHKPELMAEIGAAVERIHRREIGQAGEWRGALYDYTEDDA